MRGCGGVKETDELDVLLQYCKEIFGKVVYIMELETDEDNVMEWNDIELETGETYVGQSNCEDVAGRVFDVTGLEMEWSDVESETGETYVGGNNYEQVAGIEQG